jgi:hypothetical protein
MLQLNRNNRLLAALIALMVSVSAAGMSLTGTRGPAEHGPVIALAVLPANTRWEDERGYAVGRSIRSRLVRRLRKSKAWRRRLRRSLRPRLSVHEWYARGPPR